MFQRGPLALFVFLSFIFIFFCGFNIATEVAFKKVFTSEDTLIDVSEWSSSSKIECAQYCSLALDRHLCTAFHFHQDAGTCKCGMKMSFGYDATNTEPETPLYVGKNCGRRDSQGKTRTRSKLIKAYLSRIVQISKLPQV